MASTWEQREEELRAEQVRYFEQQDRASKHEAAKRDLASKEEHARKHYVSCSGTMEEAKQKLRNDIGQLQQRNTFLCQSSQSGLSGDEMVRRGQEMQKAGTELEFLKSLEPIVERLMKEKIVEAYNRLPLPTIGQMEAAIKVGSRDGSASRY